MLKRDEDYFKDTTMTFGEHLEELRACLVKAVFGLVIGVAIGLFFGRWIVGVIEHPLEAALSRYYEDVAVTKYKEFLEVQKKIGAPMPYTEKQVERLVRKKHLIYDVHQVDVDQFRNALSGPVAGELPGEATAGGVESAPTATNQDTRQPTEQDASADKSSSGEPASDEEVPDPKFVTIFLWHAIADDPRISPKVFSATEGFMIWFKAAFVFGIVLSSPWIFWQIWSFVAAGLYPHEKKYVHLFLPCSLGLFFLGAATAYLFVFEPVLKFLFDYSGWLGFDIDPRISEWMSFVIFLPLGFGISFQLPLVMLFLERIGIFNTQAYLGHWRIAILVIFILSAVLTPADPYSIFFMAVPLTLLYFGGIFLCRLLPRGQFAVEAVT